jgi:hypothetical protein
MPTPEPERRGPAAPETATPLAYYAPEGSQTAPPLLPQVAKWLSLSFIPFVILAFMARSLSALAMSILLPLAGAALGLIGTATNRSDDRARRTSRTAFRWGLGQLLVVLALSVFLPSTGRPREPAQRIKCASNLRQIGQALQIYSAEYGGMYPPSFDELLTTQDILPEAFVCPSSDDERAQGATTRAMLQDFHAPGRCSYVYAFDGQTIPAPTVTAQHVLVFEDLVNHNHKGMNVLYGDGTVTWLNQDAAAHVTAELQAGHNPPRPAR